MINLKNVLIGLLATLSFSSHASVLYDNGPITGNSNLCADTSGECLEKWTVFDNFSVGEDVRITSIEWSAFLHGGSSDFYGARAQIYSAEPVAGNGVLLVEVPLQPATLTPQSDTSFRVILSGLNIDLTAGTYWLGMQMGTYKDNATVASVVGDGIEGTQWQNDGAGYRGNRGNFAFTILGDVRPSEIPEPTTIPLVVIGVFALVSIRSRKNML